MEKIIYEYALVRYVADVEREEFLNVGLMMMSKRWRWMRCRICVDERKVAALFNRADIARLRCQLKLFERDDVPHPGLSVEERYRWLAAVKSAVVQTSHSHPGIILFDHPVEKSSVKEMLNQKFDELFTRLVL